MRHASISSLRDRVLHLPQKTVIRRFQSNPDPMSSSIFKKIWMALTGLFLCVFLLVHLAGNLQLIYGAPEDFNAYSQFMTTFPVVKLISYFLYFSILFHALWGIWLERQNRAARPVKYVRDLQSSNTTFAGRNMAVLGLLVLIFLVIHMRSFWYEMHWGDIGLDMNGNKDLYTVTVAAFDRWWYTLFYVICMIALGIHLSHGFHSSFQTMGINHRRYSPILRKLGLWFSVVIPGLFASIPVYFLLT